MNRLTKNYKTIIPVAILLIGGAIFYAYNSGYFLSGKESATVPAAGDAYEQEADAVSDTVQEDGAGDVNVIGNNPTAEDINDNPYIKHIRAAISSYLAGTHEGLEDAAVTASQAERKCGLESFSKEYYQSKFFIFDAGNNENGGVSASIVFKDKPDTIFNAWVYDLSEAGEGKYVLRRFCEQGPEEPEKAEFSGLIRELLKTGEIIYFQ